MNGLKQQALSLWQMGVAAVDGQAAVARMVPMLAPPDAIIAVGKAAPAMAEAALQHFGACLCLVVTKEGHARELPDHVIQIEAAHPVPDARSLRAGAQLRGHVEAMATGTRLLMLVSGGASALAEDLLPGVSLADLTALNQRLLSQGLDIAAMNAQRRRVSRIKGGNLLSGFWGAAVDVLAISDVEGDDIAVIGSGIGAAPEKCDFDYDLHIVASNQIARAAAATAAAQQQLTVLENAECLYDDVQVLATEIGARLRTMPPGVIILGGEPVVTLPDAPGEGGRNQALALALAKEIAGISDLVVLVAGTDGGDGPTPAAGGIVDGTTWQAAGEAALRRADSASFLAQRQSQLITGPTGTNVMDLLVAIRA